MTIQAAQHDVRERAYALWEARSRPDGSAEDDWFAAEIQIKAELDAVSSPLESLAQVAAETLEESDDDGVQRQALSFPPRRS